MSRFQEMCSLLGAGYFIRTYLVGACYALMVMGGIGGKFNIFTTNEIYGIRVFCVVTTILYPFAYLVLRKAKETLITGTYWVPVVPYFVAKFFISYFLWMFAIIFAPLGLLYLWFKTR